MGTSPSRLLLKQNKGKRPTQGSVGGDKANVKIKEGEK